MELQFCPYCEVKGLVLIARQLPGGLEVSGHCTICGYTCDSDFASADQADDLRAEYEYNVLNSVSVLD